MLKKYKNNQLIKVIITILLIWTSGAMVISMIEPGAFNKISNSLWWAISCVGLIPAINNIIKTTN